MDRSKPMVRRPRSSSLNHSRERHSNPGLEGDAIESENPIRRAKSLLKKLKSSSSQDYDNSGPGRPFGFEITYNNAPIVRFESHTTDSGLNKKPCAATRSESHAPGKGFNKATPEIEVHCVDSLPGENVNAQPAHISPADVETSTSVSNEHNVSESPVLNAFGPDWRESWGEEVKKMGIEDDLIRDDQEFIMKYISSRNPSTSVPAGASSNRWPETAFKLEANEVSTARSLAAEEVNREEEQEDLFPHEESNPCSVCLKLSPGSFYKRLLTKAGLPSSKRGCMHHESWHALLTSAEKGCRICALFRDILLPHLQITGNPFSRTYPGSHIWVGPSYQSSMSTPKCDAFLVELGIEPGRAYAMHEIGIYLDRGNDNVTSLFGKRLSRRPKPDKICKQVLDWLSTEPQRPPTTLPKRVIDVGGSLGTDKVTLVTPYRTPLREKIGRYVCLSHRWGKNRPLTTTSTTIQDRVDGIALDDLTQTFRDAILITRKLNIKYLWIDSLCIIQDSKEDWEQESSKMGAYYGAGWLTIAAAMSGDGLFSERIKPQRPYYKLELATTTMYFTHEPHNIPIRGGSGPDQSPLYSRGWTLQEEMLAPRFLSFEPTQVFLRCDGYVYTESGRKASVNPWNSLGKKHLLKKELWPRIIEDYSRRTLTNITDKLPALSGLAHEYRDIWNDTYLAGLWRDELWKQLLWSAKYPRRPPRPIAPSWSWASVDSEVAFIGTRFQSPEVELLHAVTLPAGNDPLGQVCHGKITLSAVVIEVALAPAERGAERRLAAALPHSPDTGFKMTEDEDCAQINRVTFVYITQRDGLALRPVHGTENTFRRVGSMAVPIPCRPNDPRQVIQII